MPHRVVAILAFLVAGAAMAAAQTPPLNACGAIPCPPETRQAEDRLTEAWRDAWSTTVRPASLLATATWWRPTLEYYAADWRRPSFPPADRRRRAEDVRQYMEYHERALREWNRQDRAVRRAAAAQGGTPASGEACFGDALSPCRVVGSGELRAAAGAPRLAWQIQEGRASDLDGHAGTVVLASGPDGWRPVAWAFSGSSS